MKIFNCACWWKSSSRKQFNSQLKSIKCKWEIATQVALGKPDENFSAPNHKLKIALESWKAVRRRRKTSTISIDQPYFNQVNTRLKAPEANALLDATIERGEEAKTCTNAARVFSNKSYCLSFAWLISMVIRARKIISWSIRGLFFVIGEHLTAIFISSDSFRCRERENQIHCIILLLCLTWFAHRIIKCAFVFFHFSGISRAASQTDGENANHKFIRNRLWMSICNCSAVEMCSGSWEIWHRNKIKMRNRDSQH